MSGYESKGLYLLCEMSLYTKFFEHSSIICGNFIYNLK